MSLLVELESLVALESLDEATHEALSLLDEVPSELVLDELSDQHESDDWAAVAAAGWPSTGAAAVWSWARE